MMENTGSVVVNTEVRDELNYNQILYILLGFFIGQADIAPGLYPFVLVYCSLFIEGNKLILLLTFLSTLSGLIYAGGFVTLSYCGSIAGFFIYKLFEKKYGQKIWIMALLISLSFLITSFIFDFLHGELLYRYLLKTGESILIFLLILITRSGFENLSFSKQSLNNLEKITYLIFSVALLIGLNFLPGYGIVINIIILLIIIGAAYATGIELGIFLAVVYGLIFISCGVIPMVTMVKYLIFALITAFFKNKKRIWMSMSFLISFLLYSGFSPSLYNIKITLLETIIGLAVFLIIPPYVWDYIFKRFSFSRPAVKGSEINKRYEEDFKQQLIELSDVFTELSLTFNEVLPAEEKEKKNRFNDFVYLFRNKNCKNCSQKTLCWGRNKKKLLTQIEHMLMAARKKGKMSQKICDQHLGIICKYSDIILPGIKSSFELFQINTFWRDRLIEKQKIVSAQLSGIGNIVRDFSYNTALNSDYRVSLQKIKNKLLINNIDLYDISINSETQSQRVNFKLRVEPCQGNKPCLHKILHILNSEFAYDFRLLENSCGNILQERPCYLHYGPVGRYELELFFMQEAVREDVSGDTLLHKKMKNGKDLIVLCDGMGVGTKASGESERAVNLLKNIMEAGFKQKLAIKIINSALFLRNQDERFTTMDIAFFDTFTGEMEMEKIGAVATFIKRGWQILTLRSSSLPVGIMESIETTSHKERLKENDVVFMLSDGLLDAIPGINDREGWFTKILKNISFDSPSEYAEYIREIITEKGKVKDDISIIIFKIKGRK